MEEIEVIIQSILPSNEPQGQFHLRVSLDATVGSLLKQLCREAGTSVKPVYCLRTKDLDILNRADTLAQSGLHDGAFLHWTSESNGVDTVTEGKGNIFWFIAVASFVVGVVGLVTICIIRFSNAVTVQEFAIVFDAGSTHTSMFIYKWDGCKTNGTAVATQFGKSCTVGDCGISEFNNDPQKAGESFQSCIDKAAAAIPASQHSNSPIYLGATAGMRLLRKLNETASEAILDSIRATFSDSAFKFYQPLKSVRIISGSEEGTFSWISSNYITNAFKVKRPDIKEVLAYTIVPTIGAMDLGGGSAQITFVPKNGTKMPSKYTQTVQLFGTNYTLYSHSHLCYGVKEVARRIFAYLVLEQLGETEIQHPCLPAGYNLTQTFDEIFDSACISNAPSIKASNYTFVGVSNYEECFVLLRSLFNDSACSYNRCSFDGVYQPRLSGLFYAFSSFYYVTNFLKLTNLSTSCFKHQDFVKTIENLCQSNWTQLQEWPVTEIQKRNLMFYCLQANYIDLLLSEGYNFTGSLWDAIHFVASISGTHIGWTLGFVLNESNNLQSDCPEVTMKILTFALLIALFCLFVILGLILMFELRRARHVADSRCRKLSYYGAI